MARLFYGVSFGTRLFLAIVYSQIDMAYSEVLKRC